MRFLTSGRLRLSLIEDRRAAEKEDAESECRMRAQINDTS
jgi:hypothetical protein